MKECNVFVEYNQNILSDKQVQSIGLNILEEVNQSGKFSIHLVGDDKIIKLNEQYRNKEETTDVLSFAMTEGFSAPEVSSDLGDIFISIPEITRQAEQYEVSQQFELTRIIIHGVLHLLGYDHQQKEEAEEMYTLQEELLKDIYHK